MGKNLLSQRRGRGSPTFRAPSFRYAGRAAHPNAMADGSTGVIEDFIKSQGHSTPLMVVKYGNEEALTLAPEGVRIGENLSYGKGSELSPGNVLALADIPEGMAIFNIEGRPGDGGRYARTSGSAARIVAKTPDTVTVRLPSKKEKQFNAKCRAIIGTAAAGGRPEKPLLKAGFAFHKAKAKNKFYPSVSATSMNAVAHPFGGKGSHTKGRPHQSGRGYPAGRKVGKIAPRRTGRKR
ncbi:MAG: 50S ribosomal protein L2 [Nanoarchaeota archaeon]|nr:50S ribosomal protein L2 [Nanoarchaeota archaeon]